MSDFRYQHAAAAHPRDHHHHPGAAHPVIKSLTAATLGAGFLLLSGLTLTGTVIALITATPVLVIFSPVLVPAAITLFLVTAGFVASGGFGLGAVAVLTWMYNYMAGKHPVGADQLDYARAQIARKAYDVKEKAVEYGHYVQQKAQDVAHTA